MKRSILLVAAGTAAAATIVAGAWRLRPGAADLRAAAAVVAASPSPSPTVSTARVAAAQRSLTAALDGALAGTPTRLSLAVRDDRTGVTLTYRTGDRYQTASVVKVDILATLLLQAKAQGRELTDDEQRLARLMITASDNAAASELWADIGAGAGLTAANRTFRLTGTTAGPDDLWGTTTTTVSDQLTLLETVLDPAGPLGATRASYLAGLMGQVESDQDWGVTAAARPGETTILKNGWDTLDTAWNVNSAGRLSGGDGYTLVVLSTGSGTEADGIARVEAAARQARAHLDPLRAR